MCCAFRVLRCLGRWETGALPLNPAACGGPFSALAVRVFLSWRTTCCVAAYAPWLPVFETRGVCAELSNTSESRKMVRISAPRPAPRGHGGCNHIWVVDSRRERHLGASSEEAPSPRDARVRRGTKKRARLGCHSTVLPWDTLCFPGTPCASLGQSVLPRAGKTLRGQKMLSSRTR